jgi:CRP-like cAMP-binding protein
MKHFIREVFDRQAVLNDHEWSMFEERLFERNFKKGDFLLKEGEVENNLSFIVEGAVRIFTYNKKDEDISIGFATERYFCSSYSSFVSRKLSLIAIQALEDVKILCMSYDNLQDLYRFSHTGERLGRINAELTICFKEEREIVLLTMSAKERYQHLIETQPKLLELVKLEHLATYLGITPQSLSRIRRELLQT